MNSGLSKVTIEKICAVFANFAEIEQAVLYGSRAQGNFKPGSDIDLTLKGAGLTEYLRGEIADKLDDLLLPYSIDLSLLDKLDHAALRKHIERVGVVFYKRGTTASGVFMAEKTHGKLPLTPCKPDDL